MDLMDSRLGTPDAVTAGNNVLNACQELQCPKSLPFKREAKRLLDDPSLADTIRYAGDTPVGRWLTNRVAARPVR